MTNMEFTIIASLLCIDIALQLIIKLRDEMKPKPVTFLEIFNLIYDENEAIKKMIEENDLETRKQAFQNFLNLKDEIRKK